MSLRSCSLGLPVFAENVTRGTGRCWVGSHLALREIAAVVAGRPRSPSEARGVSGVIGMAFPSAHVAQGFRDVTAATPSSR